MDYSVLVLAAVPVAGFAAGFINTLAGNGSLLTLPMLILLGLPANDANATNRVGVLLQNVVAVAAFRKLGAFGKPTAWALVLPSLAGGILGAELAVDIDELLMRRTIAVLMLVMLIVMLADPNRWLVARAADSRARPWLTIPLMFVIGIYGGFIQVGVGIFLLASLVLGAGYELVGANAVKNLIVLVFTAAALVVFVLHGQVHWELGLLLAVGQSAGAWVAAHMAVARGARFVRFIVVAVVLVSATALLLDMT